MENKGFSVGLMIKEGWKQMRSHVWFFIGFLILYFVIPLIPYGVAYSSAGYPMDQSPNAIGFFVWLIHYILFALVTIGLIKVSLALSIHETPKWQYLFSGFRLIIKFIIGQFLYALITIVGLALLVIPGVIWGLRYSLYGFFIVDRGAGPVEAFHLSAKATKGAKWDLLAFLILSTLINLLGILCLVIGLFVTIPVLIVAHAFIYRKLVAETNFALE